MSDIEFPKNLNIQSNFTHTPISEEDLFILNDYIKNSEIIPFSIFMSKKVAKNLTFLKAIENLLKVCPHFPTDVDRFKTNLTQGGQMQVVIDFFHSINPELGIQVESIFSKSQETFDVHLISDKQDKRYGENFVAEHSGSSKLDFTVTFDDSISDMVSLAHELSHATGARVLEHFEVFNNAQENKSTFQDALIYHTTRKLTDVDCISEIESHIIELLFYDYLQKLKIITAEQKQEFINERKTTFRNNLIRISNECHAIEHLGNNVTQDSFAKFVQFCDKNNNDCVNFIKKQISKIKNGKIPISSKHAFRYVVAEIVSTLWFNKFQKSTVAEKRKMIKTFLSFHQSNTSAGLISVVSDLLGTTIAEAGKEFYELKLKENKQNFEF